MRGWEKGKMQTDTDRSFKRETRNVKTLKTFNIMYPKKSHSASTSDTPTIKCDFGSTSKYVPVSKQ